MKNLNSVTVEGRLGDDPRIHTFDNGDQVVSGSVCVNTTKRSGDNDNPTYEDAPNWVDFKVNGGQAKLFQQFGIGKGTSLVLQGHLEQEKWTAQDGSNRSRIVVKADFVRFPPKAEAAAATGGDDLL